MARGEPHHPPGRVERATELTKDALTVIAQAAPGPIARSEVFKAPHRAWATRPPRTTKRAVINGLDALAEHRGGGSVKRASDARRSVVYEMNAAVAKQVLRALRG